MSPVAPKEVLTFLIFNPEYHNPEGSRVTHLVAPVLTAGEVTSLTKQVHGAHAGERLNSLEQRQCSHVRFVTLSSSTPHGR